MISKRKSVPKDRWYTSDLICIQMIYTLEKQMTGTTELNDTFQPFVGTVNGAQIHVRVAMNTINT